MAAYCYLVGSYISLLVASFTDGLSHSDVLWLISCLPLAASYLFPLRVAIANTAFCAFCIIAITLYDKTHDVEQILNSGPFDLLGLRLITLCIVSGYAIHSMSNWQRQVRQLEKQSKELEVAHHLAEDANRAKSRFLANMSHEIRTPMNGILGMTKHLMDSRVPPHEQAQTLETIHRCGENLLAILNDILDLSKVEAGKLDFIEETINLRQIALEVQSVFLAKANTRGLELLVKGPTHTEYHRGDASRLRQVLSNIVGNAVKFSDRGSIEIHIELNEKLSSERGDMREVFISVSDEGIGMSENALESLFTEFEQGSSRTSIERGGTGLGLAISRRFVETMGGKIHVDSQLGRGTCFCVELPLLIANQEQIYESQSLSDGMSSHTSMHNRKVLVVDDNAVNCKVASLHFAALGAQVDLAHDGKEAVEKVEQENYDLVLMDVRMPVMGGLAATRAIRRMKAPRCDLPIVAITANAFAEDKARCFEAGMNAYLAKPFRREDLLACLDELELGPATQQVA